MKTAIIHPVEFHVKLYRSGGFDCGNRTTRMEYEPEFLISIPLLPQNAELDKMNYSPRVSANGRDLIQCGTNLVRTEFEYKRLKETSVAAEVTFCRLKSIHLQCGEN